MQRNYINLVCDMGEISGLIAGSTDLQTFLNRMVEMVASHLVSDVCSIYLYNNESDDLELKATVGLNPKAVGTVRLKQGEGLVGTCLKELHPIIERNASKNPLYKYFPETNEKRYESFLAVPIHRSGQKIGVLVVQRQESNYFHSDDITIMIAVASQLAGTIENVKVLMNLSNKESEAPSIEEFKPKNKMIRGTVASPGLAIAKAYIFHQTRLKNRTQKIESTDLSDVFLFRRAIEDSFEQIQSIERQAKDKLPEVVSLIFSAHLIMLRDAKFIGEMETLIEGGLPAHEAVMQVADHYYDLFSHSSSPMIREKANDVEDLANRIINNLLHLSGKTMEVFNDRIVIARTLFPSDLIKFAFEDVRGVILVGGGVTTHVSIIARSLEIPLIISNKHELLNIVNGTLLILDGEVGNIYISPASHVIEQFDRRNITKQMIQENNGNASPTKEITQTTDGVQVHLLANINLLSEIDLAHHLNAEGVGLYRSEFPFLVRSFFPTEEEQYAVYKTLFDKLGDKPLTIRTLDIGGEKTPSYHDNASETNPELGLRSIRFSLKHPDIFEAQIRAILRAGAEINQVNIMFPMIVSLDEFRKAKSIVLACQSELERAGIPHAENISIGTMVEVPALVPLMDDLIYESEFFSIGTNDFVQYMLAVDRGNERVASYYCPHHPAVLRALATIAQTAARANRPVTICGEMTHQIQYLPFLLGIGIRKLSLDPHFIPQVQQQIETLNLSDCELLAGQLLNESSIEHIEHVLGEFNIDLGGMA